jgi:hypothetical protein
MEGNIMTLLLIAIVFTGTTLGRKIANYLGV